MVIVGGNKSGALKQNTGARKLALYKPHAE